MPSDEQPPKTLAGEVDKFRAELASMLTGVLKVPDFELRAQVYPGESEQTFVIQDADLKGIALRIDDEVMFRLEIVYRCRWNDAKAYFAVEGSSFMVRLDATRHPIISFDYERSAGSMIPASHVNIHANNDEVVYAMMASGRKNRGKSRARSIEGGNVPRLADLHIPTGGHRFRPCLEDVVEMLVLEFGVDVKPNYKAALQEGRTRYRLTQLRTAVSDSQATAASILRDLDWQVVPPHGWTEQTGKRFSGY